MQAITEDPPRASGLPTIRRLTTNMTDLLALISRHGYAVITALVFAEAIGLPVPAAVALVAGGAAAGAGKLSAPVVLGLALSVTVTGDWILFVLGRYMGWALLGFLCKVSANPETCILRSAESFYKRGKVTLLVAKFIPGVNTMAPPLAGSMKMRPWQFFRLDLGGAFLYTSAYFTAGYIFRDFLKAMLQGFYTAGRALELTVLFAIFVYVVYRIVRYRKSAMYRIVPRAHVEELALRIASGDADRILVADVRSHGYYDADSARIRGSVRIEPNNLSEELKSLPKDKDIYVYCT